MITVVCFKWYDRKGRYNDRFVYTAGHVNALKRMVARHLSCSHEFVCVTDDPAGLDPDIRSVPICRTILERAGNRYPKLMVFRPDAASLLGRRILLLDLDTIIVGPLDALVAREDSFVAWQEQGWGTKPGRGKYNTSMVLLTAGAHAEVWMKFEEFLSKSVESEPVKFSDQALVGEVLGDSHPVWTREDGVLSFRRDICRKRFFARGLDPMLPTRLPRDARVVFFHGGIDPLAARLLTVHPWMRESVH